MPMIDLYARKDLFPPGTDRQLAEQLAKAVIRAEGVTNPGPYTLNNTAAHIHRMEPEHVHTAATDSARTVHVQIITPTRRANARWPETTGQRGHRDRHANFGRSYTGNPDLGATHGGD